MSDEIKESLNFIEQIVEDDIAGGKHDGRIHTRFPPEPNGYLHIGHAKAICLNFGLAQKYNGLTNLRFDDTNPVTEDTEYVESIKEDVRWLGYDWGEREYFASDYFPQLFDFALQLIRDGKAYVEDAGSEEIAALKGTPTVPGTNSPSRDRSVEENLTLFTEMKEGKHAEGTKVLRAKIDMSSPNMLLRDPVIYRIKFAHHHRTGDAWCIYPMYDFAHGQSDSIEMITHSICTLEFENHRPLYNWCIEALGIFPSRQIEFARLNLSYTIMSKRKLLQLVKQKHVSGWDDPRMPTISGMRRRGYTPLSLREFAHRVGIAKRDNIIDVAFLEFCVREDLNRIATRAMVVLDPVKVTITNFPSGHVEMMDIDNNPENPAAGVRQIPFSGQLYIEREDFMVDPPKKYFRMTPGQHVRLKSGYIVLCESYESDPATGLVSEIFCSYIPESRSGSDTSGIKAKGTLHWVSASHAVDAEVRLYDRLFTDESPDGHEDKDFLEFINPDSLQVISKAKAEPGIREAKPGEHFQFLRLGYFCADPETTSDKPVFNRTVTLKDSWAKEKGA